MKNKINKQLAVCGMAAVKALAKEHPEKIRKLYYTEDNIYQFGSLCKYLAQNKIPYNKVEPLDLEKLCGSVHHQGAVAMIDEEKPEALTTSIVDEWIENNESAVLLDRIGNANNLGAIIRSAAFFGIKNIVLPLNESQSAITTSTYRVAQGGMEYVKVYSIRSAVRLLQDLEGRMTRIGTDVRTKTSSRDMKKFANGKPIILVLGNEETGVSNVVLENCDKLVVIPSAAIQNKEEQRIESLNVAQAASVLFYEMANIKNGR